MLSWLLLASRGNMEWRQVLKHSRFTNLPPETHSSSKILPHKESRTLRYKTKCSEIILLNIHACRKHFTLKIQQSKIVIMGKHQLKTIIWLLTATWCTH